LCFAISAADNRGNYALWVYEPTLWPNGERKHDARRHVFWAMHSIEFFVGIVLAWWLQRRPRLLFTRIHATVMGAASCFRGYDVPYGTLVPS
jgi:hypothetical protein